MKKHILLSTLLISLFSGSAFAEKVTYEQAVKDSDAYYDSLPQHENATSGLSDNELNPTDGNNQMGTWVEIQGDHNFNGVELTRSAIGQKCVLGMRGGQAAYCYEHNNPNGGGHAPTHPSAAPSSRNTTETICVDAWVAECK
ncbi:hypothetical protein [Aliivibrio fischeri]|uniref:hypothetical protein n=1 Tax=Aliivibrio fischeri TaxID=668 RepID=UPI00084C0E3B|nr:hypothetical protein [Aliivibrio fischeri]OED56716.1 hypothetical protein BEI47_13345 [Aliivibrio fischeri]